MSVQSCTALELRAGFDVGLYDRADVAAWVERRILADAPPCDVLLELATLSHRSGSEIAGLLNELVPTNEDPFLLYVKAAAMMFRAERLSAVAALRVLGRWISHDGTREEDEVDRLIDGLSLAQQGVYGSVAETEEEIAEFLTRALETKGDA